MGFATFWATYSAGLPDFLTQLTKMKRSNNLPSLNRNTYFEVLAKYQKYTINSTARPLKI
jgi:hypothetical protein